MSDRKIRRAKEKLYPFARVWAKLVINIENISTRQLRAYLMYCDRLTRTNCWWATYQVAQIIRPLIQKELKLRGILNGN